MCVWYNSINVIYACKCDVYQGKTNTPTLKNPSPPTPLIAQHPYSTTPLSHNTPIAQPPYQVTFVPAESEKDNFDLSKGDHVLRTELLVAPVRGLGKKK